MENGIRKKLTAGRGVFVPEPIRLVCPECDTIHRVKNVTLGKLYRCQKCKTGLVTMSQAVLRCPACAAESEPAHIEVSRVHTCAACEEAPFLELTFPTPETAHETVKTAAPAVDLEKLEENLRESFSQAFDEKIDAVSESIRELPELLNERENRLAELFTRQIAEALAQKEPAESPAENIREIIRTELAARFLEFSPPAVDGGTPAINPEALQNALAETLRAQLADSLAQLPKPASFDLEELRKLVAETVRGETAVLTARVNSLPDSAAVAQDELSKLIAYTVKGETAVLSQRLDSMPQSTVDPEELGRLIAYSMQGETAAISARLDKLPGIDTEELGRIITSTVRGETRALTENIEKLKSSGSRETFDPEQLKLAVVEAVRQETRTLRDALDSLQAEQQAESIRDVVEKAVRQQLASQLSDLPPASDEVQTIQFSESLTQKFQETLAHESSTQQSLFAETLDSKLNLLFSRISDRPQENGVDLSPQLNAMRVEFTRQLEKLAETLKKPAAVDNSRDQAWQKALLEKIETLQQAAPTGGGAEVLSRELEKVLQTLPARLESEVLSPLARTIEDKVPEILADLREETIAVPLEKAIRKMHVPLVDEINRSRNSVPVYVIAVAALPLMLLIGFLSYRAFRVTETVSRSDFTRLSADIEKVRAQLYASQSEEMTQLQQAATGYMQRSQQLAGELQALQNQNANQTQEMQKLKAQLQNSSELLDKYVKRSKQMELRLRALGHDPDITPSR
jgi:hypothetical protein